MCKNDEYHVRLAKLGKNLFHLENNTLLTARYASSKTKIEEEYILMGGNAIIAASGGSLGLFLGFSCHGVIMKVFEMVESAYNTSSKVIRRREDQVEARNDNESFSESL